MVIAAHFFIIHQTVECFAFAWGAQQKNAKVRSESRLLFLRQATRTGGVRGDQRRVDKTDAPNHRNGCRTEIEFMIGTSEIGNSEPKGSDISKDS